MNKKITYNMNLSNIRKILCIFKQYLEKIEIIESHYFRLYCYLFKKKANGFVNWHMRSMISLKNLMVTDKNVYLLSFLYSRYTPIEHLGNASIKDLILDEAVTLKLRVEIISNLHLFLLQEF